MMTGIVCRAESWLRSASCLNTELLPPQPSWLHSPATRAFQRYGRPCGPFTCYLRVRLPPTPRRITSPLGKTVQFESIERVSEGNAEDIGRRGVPAMHDLRIRNCDARLVRHAEAHRRAKQMDVFL